MISGFLTMSYSTAKDRILYLLLAASIAAGAVQPFVLDRAMTGGFHVNGDLLMKSALSAVFFASFFVILIVIDRALRRMSRLDEAQPIQTVGDYFTLLKTRDAPYSTSIVRALLACSMMMVLHKYLGLIYGEGYLFAANAGTVDVVRYPKLIDRIVPLMDVPYAAIWWACMGIGIASAVGFLSRLTFPALWFLTLYYVSWYESGSLMWSHGEVPILMASFPLIFANLSGRWSVDRWAFKVAQGADSPYLPLFFAQAFAALFYAGAFYSKMVFSGMDWVFSDHLLNSLTFAWEGPNISAVKPFYVDLIKNNAVMMVICGYGHLVMQAIPLLFFINAHSARHRALEAVAYYLSAFMLWAVIGHIWPWFWWLGVALIFIDYEALFTRAMPLCRRAMSWKSPSLGFGLVPVMLVIYIGGFVTQFPARALEAYPFVDHLGFYSLPYDVYPYQGERTTLFSESGLARGAYQCPPEDVAQTGSAPCVQANILRPDNKNSPLLSSLSAYDGAKMAALLSWCAGREASFCGRSAASGAGEYLGFWQGEYQFVNGIDGARHMMPIFLGFSAFIDGDDTVYVSYADDVDSVSITLHGSIAAQADLIRSVVVMNGARGSLVTGPEARRSAVDNGVRYTIAKGDMEGVCMLGLEMAYQGSVLPIYGKKYCSWRK